MSITMKELIKENAELKQQEIAGMNAIIDWLLGEEIQEEIGIDDSGSRNIQFMICRLCSFCNDQKDCIDSLRTQLAESKAEAERLRAEAKGRIFAFKGWRIMKVECVPIGQIWMNPNEQALKGRETE